MSHEVIVREENSILVLSRIDLHGVIKVADFGLTEDMYGTNYFRRRKSESDSEEKVPIRWMAPESIEHNIYNESSDVVSMCILTSSLNPIKTLSNCVVVIWCNSLGDIQLWKNSILWNPCRESTEGTTDRTKTGKTTQYIMFG